MRAQLLMERGRSHVAVQLKASRRDVANLLRTGKVENARIRVEAVMREESILQAYEGAPLAAVVTLFGAALLAARGGRSTCGCWTR